MNILNTMKTAALSSVLLLTGCIEGFEKHLQDAIDLYSERKDQYAEETNGATNSLFTKLITTETLLLPVAKSFDARAVEFVEKGIPIIQNDFVPMEDNLGYGFPLPPANPFTEASEQRAEQIIKDLNKADKHNAVEIVEAVNTALLEIDLYEKEEAIYLPMSKHLIESLGFGALHSLYYRCDSKEETYQLGQDLMVLQAIAVKIGNSLSYDKQANEFHQQQIGILVNDLPHIPFLKEYDHYKAYDEARLMDCLGLN